MIPTTFNPFNKNYEETNESNTKDIVSEPCISNYYFSERMSDLKDKLEFYKKEKINITFRLIERPEYFFSGLIHEIIGYHYILLELETKEKALIFLKEISLTSIHPSSINPIQYFERKEIPEWKRNIIFERCKGKCELKLEGCTHTATEIDHWIPISKGGTDDILNLRGSCSNCNKIKSDKIL